MIQAIDRKFAEPVITSSAKFALVEPMTQP